MSCMPCTLTSSPSMSQQCQLPRSMMNHSHIESVNPEKVLKIMPVFESIDPFAAAARLDEEPADDEAEDHETRDERLRREATSLEHLTLHDRKNPYCEFCQRGRMLKRYCKESGR